MRPSLLFKPLTYWLVATLTVLSIGLGRGGWLPDELPGGTGRNTSHGRVGIGKPVSKVKPRHADRQPTSLSNDPIRFTMQINKRQVTVGEAVELTINAELLNLPPSLMFFLPGSNAYTLRLLLPTNFIQTSGDNLSEYHSAELSYPANAVKTYRIRGYFTTTDQRSLFRLLRGPAQANSQSLFVDKAQLSVSVSEPPAASGARLASFSQCVEAETGGGDRLSFADSQASGGQAVGGFGNSSEWKSYTLPAVPTTGSYTLRLFYASGDNQAVFGLIVNGGAVQVVSAPGVGRNTGPYVEKTTTISLNQGSANTLRIQGNGQGSFALDKFCIEGDTPVSSLAISPNGTQSVGAQAGSLAVSVTATNVSWTASSDNSWLTVSPASGTGNGQVSVSYAANPGSSARSASISFSGPGVATQTLTINQAGASITGTQCVEAETGGGDRLSFADSQASGGQAVGGFGNSSEWKSYTLPAVPTTGSYTLRLFYASGDNQAVFGLIVNGGAVQVVSAPGVGRNTGPYVEKTTTISLNQGSANTLRIQGNGQGSFALDKFCIEGDTPVSSLAISPNGTQTVGAQAGSLAVSVTATNVSWTASSSDNSWLTLSPASGTDNGQVSVSYAANPGSSARSASISFSGPGVATQTLTINQAGASITGTQCVEAETGGGDRLSFADSQASGGQAVGGFGNSSEWKSYTLPAVPTTGSYTLRLFYASGDNQAVFGLIVNGGAVQVVSAPGVGRNTGPYVEKTTTISLNQGSANTLRIQGNGQGSFALDKFCIEGGTPCSNPPTLSLGTPTCNGTNTYSVGYTAQSGAVITTSVGTVQGSQVINIPVGTNVTITATLNGCSTQQSANSPTCCTAPTPPTITPGGTQVVCGGSSVTLTASGCSGTVNWSTGQQGNSITVSTPGTYTATCVVSPSCSSAPSALVTITACNTTCYVADGDEFITNEVQN